MPLSGFFLHVTHPLHFGGVTSTSPRATFTLALYIAPQEAQKSAVAVEGAVSSPAFLCLSTLIPEALFSGPQQ